jgi:hypothetical protein
MNIITVKIQSAGWLINDVLSVPDDSANRHYAEVQQWINDGGVPDPLDIIDPWVGIRQKRDEKLKQSDYSQLVDVVLPGTSVLTDWQGYRQDLRDLPSTYASDSDSVVWPVEPS